MAREFLGILGPVVDGKALTAMVYQTDDATSSGQQEHYFCCPICGNCGKHWIDPDYAVVQAAHHLFSFDHKPYLEATTDAEEQ